VQGTSCRVARQRRVFVPVDLLGARAIQFALTIQFASPVRGGAALRKLCALSEHSPQRAAKQDKLTRDNLSELKVRQFARSVAAPCSIEVEDSHPQVAELREELRSRGLPVSGRKAELVDRICEHLISHSGSSDEAPTPHGGPRASDSTERAKQGRPHVSDSREPADGVTVSQPDHRGLNFVDISGFELETRVCCRLVTQLARRPHACCTCTCVEQCLAAATTCRMNTVGTWCNTAQKCGAESDAQHARRTHALHACTSRSCSRTIARLRVCMHCTHADPGRAVAQPHACDVVPRHLLRSSGFQSARTFARVASGQ
jgi:SAP domain